MTRHYHWLGVGALLCAAVLISVFGCSSEQATAPDLNGPTGTTASGATSSVGVGTTTGGLDTTTCAVGQTLCTDSCVSLTDNPSNCGSCANACAPGSSCVAGVCTCPAGQSDCLGSCVDTQSDAANCGGCGLACAVGQSCSTGSCACLPGSQDCGAGCVDVQSDVLNCGACATACSSGQSCSLGSCACLDGLTICGAGCADTTSDGANCGACGNACAAAEVCSQGACGAGCADGETQCGQSCVDTNTSVAHCGACDMACPAGQTCTAGACTCAGGFTDCGGTCVDTATDPANCGGCGTACPAGQSCSGGSCSCADGQTDCSGACVDTASDAANCGSCGNACPGGQVCGAGTCACSTAGQTYCENAGACVDTQSDAANCGSCGNSCGGSTCTAGQCDGGTSMGGAGGTAGSGGTGTGGNGGTAGTAGTGGNGGTGGTAGTGGTGGTVGECARSVGSCSSPEVQVTNVDVGVQVRSGNNDNDDTAALPMAIASMPSGGSRLAWLGSGNQVYIGELDCNDNLVGTPFSIPAVDLQDIHADDSGGVVLVTRDATNSGTDNCGGGQLCGGSSSQCRTMWMVRFSASGNVEWETQVTNLGNNLAGYDNGARFVWWYQHHGRLAFDGSNYAAYFCIGITVNNNSCVDIHEGDRMQVVNSSGSLVNHPDAFEVGCSHSWVTRIVWDPRENRFVMACTTDNNCRMAQPSPYRTIAQGNCDGTLFGGDLVLASDDGYWLAWSQGGQIRLEHFSGDSPSDQTINNAGASQHPHLVSYGAQNMLLTWESGSSMAAQVRNAGSGATVGSEFTINVPDHSYQAWKAYEDGSVAYPAAGSSNTSIRVARVMPCN